MSGAGDAAAGRLEALGVRVDGVERPGTVEEVSAELQRAAREGRRVLPVGTGAHVPPRSLPERAVLLVVDRLSGIERYEAADLTLTAGAGTTLTELGAALTEHGQWLPFDPPDVEGRTLGGLAAGGAGSPLEAGYGAVRNHVLGATAVLGDGRVVRLGGRVVKNVAGFDLLRPLVGSGGTLAVLTSICVRVFPVPATDRVLLFGAADVDEAARLAMALARAPVQPASATVLTGPALPEPALPEVRREDGDGAFGLLVRLHGSEGAVEAEQARLEGVLGAGSSRVAPASVPETTARARDRVWTGGHGVGLVHVLPDRLAPALDAVLELEGRGPRPALVADPFPARVRFSFGPGHVEALPGLRRSIERLGGTLGFERAPAGAPELLAALRAASSEPGAAERALARRIHAVYDPGGVLGGATAEQEAVA